MENRLDATEMSFFRRELEAVDTRIFEEKLPELKARQLIPTITDLGEGDNAYTYRMFKKIGKAKYAGPGANDAPRAEVSGRELSQPVRNIIASYGYNIWELKAAAKANRPLDTMRGIAARRALEQLIDESWAWGDEDEGIQGLLTLSGIQDFGGSGAWGDLDTADPDKVYADIVGICNMLHTKTIGVFSRFRVLLPLDAYSVAAQLRFGEGSDLTVLKAALANCPFLESVQPWHRCSKDAEGSPLAKDVMFAYPPDEMVVGGLVHEVDFLSPQEKGYEFEVPGHAGTGGVVCRYPVAVASCDDIT